MNATRPLAVLLLLLVADLAPASDSATYKKDVEFLLDEIEQRARPLLKQKGVDWKKVRKEFAKEVRRVKDDVDHLFLCQRLVARARDGHAAIVDTRVEVPADRRPQGKKGVGLSLGVAGKKVYVKDCWGPAASSGVRSGFEVSKIEGKSARKWLDERAAELADTDGFSTDAAALYNACHRGMADEPGTSWSFKFKKTGGGSKSVTLTCGSGGGNGVPFGPIFPPEGTVSLDRQSYGRTAGGFGYIHLRKVPGELPEQLDEMLGAIGEVPGLVLDFRANPGGGTDHDAVFSRFLAEGESFAGRSGAASGEHFTGPIVVIVDAGVASAAETVTGMLKESGRAYLIGPSHTAGMSGAKEDLTVPSGLLTVRITVRSYHAGGSGGPAIEGHGVEPHERVSFVPKLMDAGVDPFIARAEELLTDGLPRDVVKYP